MNLGLKLMLGGAAVLLLHVALLIVIGDNGLIELSHLKQRQQTLAAQNETLARENVDLYHTIKRLKNDLVFIESVARNELGMVAKDDLIVIRPNGKGMTDKR